MTEKQKLQKKGGAIFPRVPLEAAAGYAKKLVSKTHIGPQPKSVIFPGVFGASGAVGKTRSSSLKLYGLMEGETDALTATSLAKKLNMALEPELSTLLAEACLKPKIFGILYKTFQGDEVSAAKLKQQAHQSGVHPDLAQICVDTFSKSVVFAQLGSYNGENLVLKTATVPIITSEDATDEEISNDEEVNLNENDENSGGGNAKAEDQTATPPDGATIAPTPSARSVIQVNITIDSSLDTEKLEKQLALLRRYGAV